MIHRSSMLLIFGMVMVGFGFAHFDHSNASSSDSPAVRVSASSTSDSRWVSSVISVINREAPIIEHRFHVHMPILWLRFYATHRAFGRDLHSAEGVEPQAGWDNLGNVVSGTLPIGPRFLEARHRLAHAYSEWVFDRVTHNHDLEPQPAWLYDGLAELIAQSISRETCELRGHMPIPISRLSSARIWTKIRGTAQASLEYCEAETAVKNLVKRIGWALIVEDMHDSTSWADFARRVEGR